MKRLLSALTAGILLAGSASAEGFSVYDLGGVRDRDECMMKAENAVRRYMSLNGGSDVDVGSWVVYGWDMEPGDQDLTVLCPYVADVMNAFLVVHGSASEEQRIFTADSIERYFTRVK